jgi:hypothetical protein
MIINVPPPPTIQNIPRPSMNQNTNKLHVFVFSMSFLEFPPDEFSGPLMKITSSHFKK